MGRTSVLGFFKPSAVVPRHSWNPLWGLSTTADCATVAHVVARFLALLDLYRERIVLFEQLTPLGDLTVRWAGDDG